jgi:hypothetical protein
MILKSAPMLVLVRYSLDARQSLQHERRLLVEFSFGTPPARNYNPLF